MPDIFHRVGIKATAREVYNKLTTDKGLSEWWTTDTSGAGGVGSIIKFRFNGGGPDFEVTDLKPDQLVKWKHSGPMPDDWIGTEITFQLTHKENQTYILFSHSGWKDQTDFMAHCSLKWAVFLMSLKDVIETGTGNPFPTDIHIDHDE